METGQRVYEAVITAVYQQVVVCEKIGADDGHRDVGDYESPGKIAAKAQVKREWKEAISANARIVGCVEFVGGGGEFSFEKSAWKTTDVGASVNEEAVLRCAIDDAKAAGERGAVGRRP